MKTVEIVTIVIRIFALWVLVQAAGQFLTSSIWLIMIAIQTGLVAVGSPNSQEVALIVALIFVVVYAALAVALFLSAPRVARVVCIGQTNASTVIDVTRIRAGQAYHIATFVTGIIMLGTAIQPALTGVSNLLSIRGLSNFGAAYGAINLVTAALRAVVGVFLVFGSKQIAIWLASLRYDPDHVPNQRISLRVLLVLATVIAVVLILMRFLVRS